MLFWLQCNVHRASCVEKQKQKLREYKTKVAELETVISQHKNLFKQLNKETVMLAKSKVQLENKLEEVKRSNMVMKSKLETVEDNYKMQRY